VAADPIVGALNVERAAVVALLVVVRVLVVVAKQRAPVRIVVFHFRFSSAQDDRRRRCAEAPGRFVDESFDGDARRHWRLPTRSPHACKQAIARLMPSAMPTKAPASRNAAMVASCLSVARAPLAFSSSAKQRPLWTANTSGTPATTPRPFMIAASTG